MPPSIEFVEAEAPNLLERPGRRAGETPTGTQSTRTLRLRRIGMASLCALTYAALTAAFGIVLGADGWTVPEIVMLICFMISSPWLVLGFWNALIGFFLLRFAHDPVAYVAPCVAKARRDAPIEARTAVAMCIRHEDPDRVLKRLDTILKSLDATGYGDRFDLHILSDSSRPDRIAEEEAAVGAWRAGLAHPERVSYRRRASQEGFKAGNVREFLERSGEPYDFMITLDADSVMSGEAICHLIRVMQVNPKLGILQSLVVGLPARTVFARAFQFGMRASMRSYSMGSAWWAGDCGPYWGHNAAIRVRAFREHARLPEVPGGPPLGGAVLSHDLYEAVLMRQGGYEVRVLPQEGGSWEDNPASLPEFLRRNRRWCQGNMQYLRLIGRPGLPFIGRVNLAIAILMYVGAPAWIAFMIAGAAQAWDPEPLIDASRTVEFPWGLSVGLLVVMMSVLFAPKIMGYLDVLLRKSESRRYGGRGMFLLGAASEIGFGLLFAPLVSFSVTAFLIRLFILRRPIGWEAQNRDGERVRWSDALRMFWPATLFGAALTLSLALSEPAVLPWAAPVLLSYLLAAPFAVLTAYDAPGGEDAGERLGAIPEERNPPAEVRAVSEEAEPAAAIYAEPLAPFRFDGPAEKPAYSAAAPAE